MLLSPPAIASGDPWIEFNIFLIIAALVLLNVLLRAD